MAKNRTRPWLWLAAAGLCLGACTGGSGTTVTLDGGGADLPPVEEDLGRDFSTPPGDALPEDVPDTLAPDILFADTGHPEDAGWDFAGTDGDAIAADLVANWCAEEGGFGCDCAGNDDCNSEYCVGTPDGYVCTQTCIEECPDGWTCVQASGPPDIVHICMPDHPRLCRPCTKSQECQSLAIGLQELCIDYGAAGGFCGGACGEGKPPCPAGYGCEAVTAVDGGAGLQCVRVEGECDCSPLAIEEQLATDCYVQNEHGTCAGERVCTQDGLSDCDAATPAPETCNGLDDDCDGVADDSLVQEACAVENEYGACPGTVLCVGGETICQGKEPAAEQCDGLDNDCDGDTDEEFSDLDDDGIADCVEEDTDGDGVPDGVDNCKFVANPDQLNTDGDLQGDLCDPDDDGDGVLDELDCDPKQKLAYPDAPEVCDGVDNDCDGVVDNGFPDLDDDGTANCIDPDDDGDLVPDADDICPFTPDPLQLDFDGDGLGDACDGDDDGDGTYDISDCEPLNPDVNPQAVEICNGADDNCDGQVDEEGAAGCIPLFADADEDGFGAEEDQKCLCGMEPPYTSFFGGDCDDSDAQANPNGQEVCNGKDDDCNGLTDEGCAPETAVTTWVSAGAALSGTPLNNIVGAGVVASQPMTGATYTLTLGVLPVTAPAAPAP